MDETGEKGFAPAHGRRTSSVACSGRARTPRPPDGWGLVEHAGPNRRRRAPASAKFTGCKPFFASNTRHQEAENPVRKANSRIERHDRTALACRRVVMEAARFGRGATVHEVIPATGNLRVSGPNRVFRHPHG
jgi:hypothetical protein